MKEVTCKYVSDLRYIRRIIKVSISVRILLLDPRPVKNRPPYTLSVNYSRFESPGITT